MRKIEEQMAAAVKAGRNWSSGNTQVLVSGSLTEVYLHSNLIARRDSADAQNPAWQFRLAGWNTPTTRSRLNALADVCGKGRVWTQRGQAHYNKLGADGCLDRFVPVSDNEWF